MDAVDANGRFVEASDESAVKWSYHGALSKECCDLGLSSMEVFNFLGAFLKEDVDDAGLRWSGRWRLANAEDKADTVYIHIFVYRILFLAVDAASLEVSVDKERERASEIIRGMFRLFAEDEALWCRDGAVARDFSGRGTCPKSAASWSVLGALWLFDQCSSDVLSPAGWMAYHALRGEGPTAQPNSPPVGDIDRYLTYEGLLAYLIEAIDRIEQ